MSSNDPVGSEYLSDYLKDPTGDAVVGSDALGYREAEGAAGDDDSGVDEAPPSAAETTSTVEVAKDQAASLASGAVDAAQNVAGVAKDQVGQVAAEAGHQVRQLVGQAQSELSDQAGQQQQRVAAGLRSLGDQLTAMAAGSEEAGVAVDLARQAADKTHEVAAWLENRDPGSVLEEVRSFARQRPGVFLALAMGAGVVAGRLTRGLTADPHEAPDTSTGSGASTSTPPLTRPEPSPTLGYGADASAPGDGSSSLASGHGVFQTEPYGAAASERSWPDPVTGGAQDRP